MIYFYLYHNAQNIYDIICKRYILCIENVYILTNYDDKSKEMIVVLGVSIT